MQCGNCREPLEQGAAFCGNCGVKIAGQPTAPAPEAGPEVAQAGPQTPQPVQETGSPVAAQAQMPTPPVTEGKNVLAIVALVVAILGFMKGLILIGLLLDVVAIVLGLFAVRKTYKQGLAIAAMVIAAVGLVLTLTLLPRLVKNVEEFQKTAESRATSSQIQDVAGQQQ